MKPNKNWLVIFLLQVSQQISIGTAIIHLFLREPIQIIKPER